MNLALDTELTLQVDVEDRDSVARAKLLRPDAGEQQHLVSTYFDTPKDDLHTAGFSLRIRRDGSTARQMIRADGAASAGLFVRPEWDRTVPDGTPLVDARSGPLAQIIGKETIGWLGRRFVTDIHRDYRVVVGRGGSVEIAVDDGDIVVDERRRPLLEIELELKSGSSRKLFDIARDLSREIPLRLGVLSKAEQGYRLLEAGTDDATKAEPVRLNPEGSFVSAFTTLAMACLRQFRLNEDLLLRTGDADAVHQARIGLRRLRSLLALSKGLFAGDDRTRHFRRELRWMAGSLGEVRDIDALLAAGSGTQSKPLKRIRGQALARAMRALSLARGRLLTIDLVEWLAIGQWHDDPAHQALVERPAPFVAGRLLEKGHHRLKKYGRNLASLSPCDRHRIRIRAKTLRYAAELFAPLFTSPKAHHRRDGYLEALAECQHALGALNDRATGPFLLQKYGIAGSWPPPGEPTHEALLSRADRAFAALYDAKPFWH